MMLDIVIANVIFWISWYQISTIPARVTQYGIDNHHKL